MTDPRSDASGPDPSYGRRTVSGAATRRANRGWWDGEAAAYYAEHGDFLGDVRLIWGPEGLDEEAAGILGDVAGARVLEFGAGAAQGARWVASRGGRVVATDLSGGMLAQARAVDVRRGTDVPLVQCDAGALPFPDASFDVVFSAYGAVPFVADSAALMAELARVLRPGGRLAFSTTHPVRWAFPDDPGSGGLTATTSYFDRTPYVESRGSVVEYAEHHRTLGDRVREIVAAGLVLLDVVEPEWPAGHEETWGGWSPLRGRLLPGTAIFVCTRPGGAPGRADARTGIGEPAAQRPDLAR